MNIMSNDDLPRLPPAVTDSLVRSVLQRLSIEQFKPVVRQLSQLLNRSKLRVSVNMLGQPPRAVRYLTLIRSRTRSIAL